MKYLGLLPLLLGVWAAYAFRHDPAEGAYVVPGGIIVAVAGVIIYFEGLKAEIIAALKGESQKGEAGPTGGGNPQA